MSTRSSGDFAAKSKRQTGEPFLAEPGRVPAHACYGHVSTVPRIWLVDFEFDFGGSHEQGELPRPLCLVAREVRSGRMVRQWRSELGPQPPYPTDPGVLFVAYYASAELGCHLALGWPMPARILDLYVEHRARYNGCPTGFGNGLVGALAAHGLDSIGAAEKDEMRD